MDGNDFFGPWEGEAIASWDEAGRAIEEILTKTGAHRRMAWRGQVRADWSLHSSLYRRLMPADDSAAPQEHDLVEAEDRILEAARDHWRFDQMPYLELAAHMQHYSAPTRLIDVTLSPLVALWFAVEQQHNDLDAHDGRMFAVDVTDRSVNLNEQWNVYDIPWRNTPKNSKWSLELPLLWRPPSYNERIPAQQAGFLLAGVPKFYAGSNAQYRCGPGSDTQLWKADDVRQATSVPLNMVDRARGLQDRSRPTLTLRIAADAKEPIRRRLERDYGINASTMYPDLYGMAEHLRRLVDHDDLVA